MFGERPLSDLARQLFERERERQEDEGLKARAMERARAVLERDRPSGIGLKQAEPLGLARRRRQLRMLPLIAAAIVAAGLAVAGVSKYGGDVGERPRVGSVGRMRVPRAPKLAVGGALLGNTPTVDPPSAQAPAPRPPALAPAPATEGSRALNIRQYATELKLLEPARRSIARGEYGAALAAIDEHRREFPNGQLSEEREALRVRALWGMGQRPAALSAAKVFRKRYPRSGLLGWLEAQTEPKP
jgi:hypothetical protein